MPKWLQRVLRPFYVACHLARSFVQRYPIPDDARRPAWHSIGILAVGHLVYWSIKTALEPWAVPLLHRVHPFIVDLLFHLTG